MDFDELWESVRTILWSWHETKLFVEHSVGFSHDSIHVIGGVLALLAAALLFRKPVSSWQPWLIVLVLTCINELADLWIERWPSAGMQYGEGFKDLLLTMLLPTVLLVASRYFPWIFAQKRQGQLKRPKSTFRQR